MDPDKRINFHFIKRIANLSYVWCLFKIKVSKSELNIWVWVPRQFFLPIFLHQHTENVGVILEPLMIEVVSKTENF